jgi:hypothetical protein
MKNKDKNENKPAIELRSEEIDAILGRVPGRISRNGITIIFAVLLFLLASSAFFSYPDIVSCRILITSANPPIRIVAKTDGEIRLYVDEKQNVVKGTLLAVYENSADMDDILLLESWIDSLELQKNIVSWRLPKDGNLRTGEITPWLLDLKKISNDYAKSLQKNDFDLNNKLSELKYRITSWKESNAIYSPCDGIVAFSKTKIASIVSRQDLIMNILPYDTGKLVGVMEIPLSNYGKIKQGQNVNIKMDSYPHMEYGIVNGVITFISPVSFNGNYTAEIDFLTGLQTNYGNIIPFGYELHGTADIIVDEMSLFDRLLQPVRSTIKRKSLPSNKRK